MSLSSYSDLKTKAASWMRRAGNATYVAEVPDMVTLAEAKLNAELGPLETNATVMGTVGSRTLDISSYAIVEPIALWLAPSGEDESRLEQQSSANLGYSITNSRPAQWAYDSEDSISLDCPLDTAYPFRFRYRGRFALSDSSPTNWLLENRPDVYLAAVLGWGSAYLESFQNAAIWLGQLEAEIPKVRSTLAKGKRGILRLDRGLADIGRRGAMTLASWTNG